MTTRDDKNQLNGNKKITFVEVITNNKHKNTTTWHNSNYESMSDPPLDLHRDFHRKSNKVESHLLSHAPIVKKSGLVNFPQLYERGIPEGQKDPLKYASSTNLNEIECNSKDTNRVFVGGKLNVSKAQLVRRFLRSIPIKVSKPAVLPLKKQIGSTLFVKNARCYQWLDHSGITNALQDELRANESARNKSNLQLSVSLRKLISSFYKAYKVLLTNSVPALAVITSDSLFIARYCSLEKSFLLEHRTSFESVLAAVVGPFSQLIIVFNKDKDRIIIDTGIDESLARDFICHLELTVRRWCSIHKQEFKFSVALINDLKSMNVFHPTLPDNTFEKDEELLAQFSVWMQEDTEGNDISPLGPQREGYLMAKINSETSWAPIYICLKGGVLYLFEKLTQRIPSFAIPLRTTFFKSCKLCDDNTRPYTFQVVVEGDLFFSFGAADGTEMKEWIRDIEASNKASNNLPDEERESTVINCTLTLSTRQILLHRFPNEIINRTSLFDVHKLTKFIRNGSCYCLLELSCIEATETGGDWILYFVSENSCRSFCSYFTKITKRNVDELGQEESSRFLSSKSDHVCARIQSLWDQFFEPP